MDFSLINRFCFNIVMEKSLRGSTEHKFIYIYVYTTLSYHASVYNLSHSSR